MLRITKIGIQKLLIFVKFYKCVKKYFKIRRTFFYIVLHCSKRRSSEILKFKIENGREEPRMPRNIFA